MAKNKKSNVVAGKFTIPDDILEATRERFDRDESWGLETLRGGEPSLLQSNSRGAVEKRMLHMGLSQQAARQATDVICGGSGGLEAITRATVSDEFPEEASIGLERILGKSELMSVRFLDFGTVVARTVGRVVIRTSGGGTAGFGTGFMVSPRLLLTNNHVLSSASRAAPSHIQFDYQEGLRGQLLDGVLFKLDPDSFFVTDRALDFALVAVGDPVDGRTDLAEFGWNRVDENDDDVLVGERVNIIQHPNGERKQLALRQNTIFSMPEDRFLQYRTDTAPGSSGSPVLNDDWEVVGLHHSGVPRTDDDGNVLTHDGQIWRRSMGDHRIDWLANEGIRIPAILQHVQNQRLSDDERRLFTQLLEAEESEAIRAQRDLQRDVGSRRREPSDRIEAGGQMEQRDGSSTWTIPLQITVHTGAPILHSGSTKLTSHSLDVDSPVVDVAEEAVSIDPDYSNREGYDSDFLGTGRRRVPLPRLSRQMKASAAVNQEVDKCDDPYELPYHHYSVVMNAHRRLAYFTAVNIDGDSSRRIRRERDKWHFDPRIDREAQAGNEIYKRNPLDRGHLVRRLDPAWGNKLSIARVANDDTFHFTNCCPQHANFNQNKTTWAGLEDYILDNADVKDFKASVFTGPVFDETDDTYRGIQLPRQFWKVVVIVKDDGQLSATAYLLSQERLLRRMDLEGFAYGAYHNFQVRVRQIEELTGLDFGKLANSDPLESVESFGTEGLAAQEIGTLADIII